MMKREGRRRFRDMVALSVAVMAACSDRGPAEPAGLADTEFVRARPTVSGRANTIRSMRHEVQVDERGLHLVASGHPLLDMRLERFGCPGRSAATRVREVRVDGDRTDLVHAGVVEWYRSDHRGVEQGFDIAAPPVCGRKLVLELDTGDLRAAVAAPRSVTLSDTVGTPKAQLRDLLGFDARGRAIPVRFSAPDGRVTIEVDATAAEFPIVIDPWVVSLETRLTPVVGQGVDYQRMGTAVALTSDTAVVGAPAHSLYERAYVFARSGSGWVPQAVLDPAGVASESWYGSSVAIDGDTVIVGAPLDNNGGSPAGSAYVFVRSGTTWSEQAKLVATDGGAYEGFGSAVSLSGDLAVVGARSDTTSVAYGGSAYVFERVGTSWTEQAKLEPNVPGADGYFGSSVAVSNDRMLVGAPGMTGSVGVATGTAYVFVRSGTDWNEQVVLESSDGSAGDAFGDDVSLAGDTAVVGAPRVDTMAGTDAGRAYVFSYTLTGWGETAKLDSGVVADNVSFGAAVSASPNSIVIGGHHLDTPRGGWAGGTFVFSRSGAGWSLVRRLEASDAMADDEFGADVAVVEGVVLVGSPGSDGLAGEDSGAAYACEDSSGVWRQTKLEAGYDTGGAAFGEAVALDGDLALVGAPGDHYLRGRARLYSRRAGTWSEPVELVPSDDVDHYGSCVALDGDTALVGALGHATGTVMGQGAVYAFVRGGSGWVNQAVLTASDGDVSTYFGEVCYIEGNTAIVGARRADAVAAASAGAAYVFARTGTSWTEQAKLEAPDGAFDDAFGSSIAIAGDTAVVGAPSDNTSAGAGAGSVHVFVRSGSTWTWQAQLHNSDALPTDQLGSAVFLSQDTAFIGASGADTTAGFAVGKVYVFTRSGTTWSEQTQLAASNGDSNDHFGRSLWAEGMTLLVGADGGSTNSGLAYVFEGSGASWTERFTLSPVGVNAYADFGNAVALSGDTALIGAPYVHLPSYWPGETGQGAGAAYLYRIAQCSTSGDCSSGYCVDGVCCDTPCGGGSPLDCQACSVATGAAVDGVCSPVAAEHNWVCRPAADACDVAERCAGTVTACPSDDYAPSTRVCRKASCAAGFQTVEATCSGSDAACPAEQVLDCDGYVCDGVVCGTTCASELDCAANRSCQGGSCVLSGTGGVGGGGAAGASGAAGVAGSSGAAGGAGGSNGGAAGSTSAGGTGGSAGSGGAVSGGAAGTSGGSGGAVSGGAAGTGGEAGAAAGAGGIAAAGSAGVVGAAAGNAGSGDDGGCGCQAPGRSRSTSVWILVAAFAVALVKRGFRDRPRN